MRFTVIGLAGASCAILGLVGCGDTTAATTTTPDASAAPTVATSTPKAAAVDPHALTAANVTQSILDNTSGFFSTNFDGLKVQIEPGGQVVVAAKPTTIGDEQGFITSAAEDALVVVKAVNGWYSGVTVIHMQLDSDFTDAYGKTFSAPGAWVEFTSATAAMLNPDGLATKTFDQPTDLFAIADAYTIHPAIWKKIDSQHRGQLAFPDNGSALITTVPA
jgi:hypothetical protein